MSEATAEGAPKPTTPKELGRISIEKSPYQTDVKALASQYFPEGKHLETADGNEYILDQNGRTIMLFEGRGAEGFTSVYSPLTPQELRRRIATLPDEQQQELAERLNLPELTAESVNAAKASGRLDDLLASLRSRPLTPHTSAGLPMQPRTESATANAAQGMTTETKNRDLPPEDLPESHFSVLSHEELETRKREQWEAVKDLPDNDLRKILYLRRFTQEFRSPVSFNPELTATSEDNFRYYVVDTSKMSELPTVEPHRPSIEVPEGKKVGFVIGYHHLEKPWGNLFMEMFQRQAQFSPDEIEFIVIQNRDIPTGDRSVASEREIQQAVAERGITDVIDVHEQLSSGNHYMDNDRARDFDRRIRPGSNKNPNGGEYTLDPFVPLWAIEQYYEGNVYPQLQDAVNEQIKKAAVVIKGLANQTAER